MTEELTGPDRRAPGASSEPATTTTRVLLACGAIAGPLFTVVALLQMAARDGFDPSRHPISLLSNGDFGWIQITNFVLAGLLFLAGAVGLRRVLHPGPGGTWGPRLIGAMGVALVWGGVFVADPADGFPPGTPPDTPDQLSWHSILHTPGPVVALLSLIVACFVFARRFRRIGRRGWAAYCTATGVAGPIIAVTAFSTGDFRWLFAGGVLLWGWASVMAAQLLTGVPTPPESSGEAEATTSSRSRCDRARPSSHPTTTLEVNTMRMTSPGVT